MRLFVIGLMVVFASGCAADRDLQPQTEQRVVAVNGSEVPVEQAEHDKRIDYIELPTTDISAAKAFYTGVFGWKTQDWGPDYTSFEDGRLAGGFRKEAEVTPGGPLVVLYAVDLEAVAAAVPSHGGAIVKEIFSFPGGRRFHFTDPSGNELAVWSDK
jgi:predicted enzyme related to lactoylglutathione lyase